MLMLLGVEPEIAPCEHFIAATAIGDDPPGGYPSYDYDTPE
jgi:hypothetical protein